MNILFLIFFSFFTYSCSHTTTVNNSPLKICSDPNNLPFSNQKQEGFENKIAELMSQTWQRPLEYTWYPQRMGFVRNTLKMKADDKQYKCDIIIGVPTNYDVTATTDSYYRSSYALVYLKSSDLESINNIEDLLKLPLEKRKKIKFGVFAQSPGVDWLLKNNLFDQAQVYQKQNGDYESYPGQILENDLISKKIDAALIWGPIAGFYSKKLESNKVHLILFQPTPDIHFDFPISMGVRKGDEKLKTQLNTFIHENKNQIETILSKYNIPLIR